MNVHSIQSYSKGFASKEAIVKLNFSFNFYEQLYLCSTFKFYKGSGKFQTKLIISQKNSRGHTSQIIGQMWE